MKAHIESLLTGERAWVSIDPQGRIGSGEELRGVALLSGSFNPLHSGHRGMHATAAQLLGREVLYELPLVNADKAPIDSHETLRRIEQFRGLATVLLTTAPLFNHKAELFPDAIFVLGVDTVTRLLSPRFYGDDREAMLSSLADLDERGCRFLVAGRTADEQGRFLHLHDIEIPPAFRHLFEPIPEQHFRKDISSTEIRLGLRDDD
ncbi:MAG: hypothetical protein KDK91_23975 [Gammaproteobacteria bacterium]|nr:hypothetical protein [Gammaproteobacteria bacterium]